MLSEGLKNNKSIYSLNISKNDITVSGIEAFTQIIQNTWIQELDLSFNPIGNAGITELANSLIKKPTE